MAEAERSAGVSTATPGRCRLMARFPFIFKSALPRFFFGLYPQWLSHTNQNAILEDDQIFLHKQERSIEIEQRAGKSYAQSCYMPTKADVYVSAFRKWIVDIAGGGVVEGGGDGTPYSFVASASIAAAKPLLWPPPM